MSYYQVDYHCTNCGTHSIKSWPFGAPAPSTYACPRCGCFTAQKSVGSGDYPVYSEKRRLIGDWT